VLVGRDPERGTLRALVAAARVGQSGTLVLTGEAGIGKTALLEDALDAAGGMRVLRATGTESEAEVPFGALLQLLRPALVHLDRIPSPQSAALASALALRPGPEGDRFAVGAATLSLLSRYAEDGPVAVLVDDAHLLDLPSAQALTFAARRLTADPIAVLATVRDGNPGPFTTSGLPVLPVGGLSLTATGELLAVAGRRPGDPAVARLHELTGGNPLALVELADQADTLEPPFGTPVPVPASVARAFARRVDRLSAPARTAVLVAAAAGGDLAVVAAACRRLGVDVAGLDEAADAGLLRLTTDGIAFRHSLVRSAVFSDAAPSARRAVHRAVAAALPATDTDRRAWHLGEAALGPDEETARTLAAVAAGARGRSAHAVASGAYERAARLSPDSADRIDRYVAAGESAWAAGLGERALALLARAAALDPAPPVRTAIAGLRGRVEIRTGSVEQARVLLVSAGMEVAGTDPDAAVLLLADAILACFFLGDTVTVADAAAVIDSLVPRAATERARLVGTMAGGVAGVLTGRGGVDRIRTAVHGLDPAAPLAQDPRVVPWLVAGPLFLRESGTGRELVRSVVDGMRRRTALGGLPLLLFLIGRDQATTDIWDRAEPTYAEGIQLARETGDAADLAACLAGLAWLEARQGREADCRAHAAEAEQLCRPRNIGLFRCWSLYALGELELGLGRPEAAVERFERLERRLADLGLADVDLSPAPEQADALVRLGREDDAREVAAGYAARAAAKGQPWALARAARAVALTCPDAELDGHAAAACGHHARTLDAYELARTQLSYGARLRRLRRRTDARAPLRAALATLEALGAAPWADQAAAELRATGETAHRRDASAVDRLTPQELQVATMLAAGRTTREAAAALFLSPKTVEYHLRHVYVKLGIRSRAELADTLDPARVQP
jgi:DNA-binding CsgD family transcriptional regulator